MINRPQFTAGVRCKITDPDPRWAGLFCVVLSNDGHSLRVLGEDIVTVHLDRDADGVTEVLYTSELLIVSHALTVDWTGYRVLT